MVPSLERLHDAALQVDLPWQRRMSGSLLNEVLRGLVLVVVRVIAHCVDARPGGEGMGGDRAGLRVYEHVDNGMLEPVARNRVGKEEPLGSGNCDVERGVLLAAVVSERGRYHDTVGKRLLGC